MPDQAKNTFTGYSVEFLPYPFFGFQKGDVILEQYRHTLLVDSNGVVQIVDPQKGIRYTPDLDDFNRPRHRPANGRPYQQQIEDARLVIDAWNGKIKESLPSFVIAEIDVNALANRLRNADWYYDYSDDTSVKQKAYRELCDISNDLTTLSADPIGWHVANRLWDQYGAPFSNEMPAFRRAYPGAPKTLDPGMLETYLQQYHTMATIMEISQQSHSYHQKGV